MFRAETPADRRRDGFVFYLLRKLGTTVVNISHLHRAFSYYLFVLAEIEKIPNLEFYEDIVTETYAAVDDALLQATQLRIAYMKVGYPDTVYLAPGFERMLDELGKKILYRLTPEEIKAAEPASKVAQTYYWLRSDLQSLEHILYRTYQAPTEKVLEPRP